MSEKILVAMSGGVDSSMTAALLQEAGNRLLGVTMQLYCGEGDAAVCGSEKDALDAAAIAQMMGFPHVILNYTAAFQKEVIDRFANGYAVGETPNPCILCNRCMKFARLWDYAKENGCDAMATGHYARVERAENGRYLLKRPLDLSKDQTYVLYHLTQEQLSHLRFPLGALTKAQVRAGAAERQLPTASKPDSQDICFVPDGDYAAFLERRGTVVREGDFIDTQGHILGKHRGHIHYTVGQRKGLGVALGHPVFVIAKNAADNTVTLGDKTHLPTPALFADDLNFISVDRLTAPLRCTARTRYHQPETAATVFPEDDGVRVVFDEAKVAAPGQAIVFYDGDTVIGGGTIRRLLR